MSAQAAMAARPRLMRLAEEFDLTLQRALALRILGSGARSMRDLADGLFCGMSSVTAQRDSCELRLLWVVQLRFGMRFTRAPPRRR